ncbi:MAG: hypothetical protein WCS99_18400 [Limisphaerales bacterium]
MKQGKYLLGVFIGTAILMARSKLFSTDGLTATLGALLLVLCLWPAAAWVFSGMRHLPLFETYSLIHLIYYWIPAGKADGEFLEASEYVRTTALGAVCLYLACGQLAYFSLLQQLRSRRTSGWRIWSNRVPFVQNQGLSWAMLGVALGYQALFQFGLIWNYIPGSALPYVRAFAGVCGLLGVFVLGRLAGEGRLTRIQTCLFVAIVGAITLVSFASGYLGTGAVFVGNAFFAYTIGARKLPVFTLVAFVAFLSFLNYGKGEMRIRYWLMGEPTNDLVEVYSFWLQKSWQQFSMSGESRENSGISAIERANLTQVYISIISQTPSPLPFLNGQTYWDSLQLFIPRILWPDRPDLNLIMSELGFRYGIHQSVESMQSTNISIGQIGEAWANGGWQIVAMVGVLWGCLFHVGVRVAHGRDVDTVGFLFGMILVGNTVNVEQLAGTVMMTYYQTALTGIITLYLFSRRPLLRETPPAFRSAGDLQTAVAPPRAE